MVCARCRCTVVSLQEPCAIWQGCKCKWSALQGRLLKKLNALLACYWWCSSLAKSQKPRQEYREHKQEMFVLSISSLLFFLLFLCFFSDPFLFILIWRRREYSAFSRVVILACCEISLELNHFQQISSVHIYLRIPLCRSLCSHALTLWLEPANLNTYLYIFSPYVNVSFTSKVYLSALCVFHQLRMMILWWDMNIC